jgi:sulfoxide reductase catalytic subunit YedY
MLIKKSSDIKSSEITEAKVYLNRRLFMRGAVLAGSVAATGFVYRKLNPPPAEIPKGKTIQLVEGASTVKSADGFKTGEAPTALEDITNYNNFYEFSTEKRGVASVAKGFVTNRGLCQSMG